VIAEYDKSDRLPESADHTELVALMGKDKKAVDGLTFVLDGPGGVEVVPGVDPLTAAVVLERMGAQP
jgi:5-deoxy-5-amino-3-dehydroquinate synthase